MKRFTIIAIIGLLLAACAPAVTPIPADMLQGTIEAKAAQLAQAFTPYPTYTPPPTQTPRPTVAIQVKVTVIAEVTRIKIVTPTSTPTPEFSPTPTLLPAQETSAAKAASAAVTATARAEALGATATAQAEADVFLKAPREAGIWLVGVDIATGLWRNDGTGTSCYWKRSTINGDIIDNHFGLGGGTAYILASDFQFETHGCGTWTWLKP